MVFNPVLETLSGHVTPVPPVWLMRQAGRYLPEYREIRARAQGFLDLCFNPKDAATVTLQPVTRFDMDAAILFADILVIPHAMGQDVQFVENEGPRLKALETGADIAAFLALQKPLTALDPILDTVQRVKTALSPAKALIGFAGAPWTVATYMVEGGSSRDFVKVKRLAATDPVAFQALIEALVAATATYLCAQIAAGADVVQIFDTWAGVLSEADARRWVISPTAAIVGAVKRQYPHIPIIGFPKGLGALAAEYVHETGVTALGLDTGASLRWSVANLSPFVTLQGNIDPVALLVGGDALDRAVDHVVSTVGQKPLIVNLGHGILPATPPEHVAQLVQRVRAVGRG